MDFVPPPGPGDEKTRGRLRRLLGDLNDGLGVRFQGFCHDYHNCCRSRFPADFSGGKSLSARDPAKTGKALLSTPKPDMSCYVCYLILLDIMRQYETYHL